MGERGALGVGWQPQEGWQVPGGEAQRLVARAAGGLAGRAERAIASRTVSTLSVDPEAVREERGEVFEEVSVKDAPVR